MKWEPLTNFKEMIPGRHELFPERQVGPEGLGEEDDDGREPEHFPHGEDKLLGFLGDDFVQAAHTSLEQNWADPWKWKSIKQNKATSD